MLDCDIVLEVDSEVPPAPELPLVSFSFSGQRQKAPRALKDYIPHSLVGLPSHLRSAPPCPGPPPSVELDVPSLVSTPWPDPKPEPDPKFIMKPNSFGLYQIFTRKPQADPEENLTLDDMLDDSMSEELLDHSKAVSTETPCSGTAVDLFHPFPNKTVF